MTASEHSHAKKSEHSHAKKRASYVGQFLRREYGIGLRDIAAKGRLGLLDEVEVVPCNLCGSEDAEPVAARDKYGLPVTTVICRRCGLMYLSPRPSAASYRRFYEGGGSRDSIYHRRSDFDSVEILLRFYYGPSFTLSPEARERLRAFRTENGFADAIPPLPRRSADALRHFTRRRAERGNSPLVPTSYPMVVYEILKKYVPVGGRVFEPGASTGRMLVPWRRLHRCKVGGVEPKRESVRQAKRQFEIDLVQGFSDDPRIPEDAYDLVLNVRTINHMLDPLADLRHARRWLKEGAIVFVDVQDSLEKATHKGFERATIEIDHPYMFTLGTLVAMVQKAGFEIVERGRPPQARGPRTRIHIVARKSADAPQIEWSSYASEHAVLQTVPPTAQRRPVNPGEPPRSPRRTPAPRIRAASPGGPDLRPTSCSRATGRTTGCETRR